MGRRFWIACSSRSVIELNPHACGRLARDTKAAALATAPQSNCVALDLLSPLARGEEEGDQNVTVIRE
jgi:hypothetical protein